MQYKVISYITIINLYILTLAKLALGHRRPKKKIHFLLQWRSLDYIEYRYIATSCFLVFDNTTKN